LAVLCASTAAPGYEQACGDANDDGTITAPDALAILRTAVDLESCAACFCDVDASGEIAATDALTTLAFAVGDAVDLACPPCAATTTTTSTTRPPLVVQCGDSHAEAPNCDGYCSVDGQMCAESFPGSGICECVFSPTPCGAAAGAPACWGACPKLSVCLPIGDVCECVP